MCNPTDPVLRRLSSLSQTVVETHARTKYRYSISFGSGGTCQKKKKKKRKEGREGRKKRDNKIIKRKRDILKNVSILY